MGRALCELFMAVYEQCTGLGDPALQHFQADKETLKGSSHTHTHIQISNHSDPISVINKAGEKKRSDFHNSYNWKK